MAKKYVPVFFDWTETTTDLDQAQKGNLIDAIVDYASERRSYDQIVTELTGIERVAFRFMKGQVDRNDEISAARSKAGSNKPDQKPTNANKPEQTQAKAEPVKRFTPPTLEEVTAYCRERKNHVDPQNFIDFYTSKGWRVGNQAMKDWKACVRTWEQRDKGVNGNGRICGTGSKDNGTGSASSKYSFLKPESNV